MVISQLKKYLLKPVLLCIAGFICLSSYAQERVSIQYDNGLAIALILIVECDRSSLAVRLKGSETNMLGKFYEDEGVVRYSPSLPFSSSQTYQLICDGKVLDTFKPKSTTTARAKVIGIYPSQNTLPENLLKIHIKFSRPMGFGQSYEHITITENGIEVHPFLKLETELWNYDRTVITLWLDPGRIKRDLAPNIQLGNPLTQGKSYELTIKKSWKDQLGRALLLESSKTFIAGPRDEDLPDMDDWHIKANRDSIRIEFNEAMDFLLIQHSFFLWQKGSQLRLKTIVQNNMSVILLPGQQLVPGSYTLKVDSKLEDLAGNNFIRPFDRDLTDTLEVQATERLLLVK